uniref:Uncharacterized protein n=1 Tax=Anguilla anguilla TaxID=7936 RepID=A0A0E9QIP3_ANGAN
MSICLYVYQSHIVCSQATVFHNFSKWSVFS